MEVSFTRCSNCLILPPFQFYQIGEPNGRDDDASTHIPIHPSDLKNHLSEPRGRQNSDWTILRRGRSLRFLSDIDEDDEAT